MISVQISEGAAALEAISKEWQDLVGDSFTAAFSHPGWFLAWLEAYPPQTIAVVTARDGDRLVGILPLARFRTDARGFFFTEIAPLARGDYQPPVVAPEYVAEALPAMLDAAIKHFGRRGVFWWPNIPVTDPSVPVLREYFQRHKMPFVEDREMAPRLRLDGCDFAGAEKIWSASHRIDVRRQRKRLAEKGPVSLWQPATLAEAQLALTDFFRVHDEKWLAQSLPGMFQRPAAQRHFRAIFDRLWGHGLLFSTVRCGDLDVSYSVSFFAGGWVQWYRPSYRHEFHNLSPGKIHLALLVEEACRLHWQGIDLLLGEEPYKHAWTNEKMEVIGFHAGFSKWSPSYFWFSRGKPYVRQRFVISYFRAQAWLQQRKLGKKSKDGEKKPGAGPDSV
jgi:CelD/BcsL family acetyltransferase involved in cellulose biosynthesis